MNNGTYQMIDVGNKDLTFRQAVASGFIHMQKSTFDQVVERRLPKGDALLLAEIAGIQAAKFTWQLIPLCHPLPIEKINMWLIPDAKNSGFHAYSLVRTHYKTGVEMEALQAISGALLTIYDLIKMLDDQIRLQNIQLIYKEGGKNGVWQQPALIPDWLKKVISQR